MYYTAVRLSTTLITLYALGFWFFWFLWRVWLLGFFGSVDLFGSYINLIPTWIQCHINVFYNKRRNRNVKILLQSELLSNSSWKSLNSLSSLLFSSWSSVAWTSSTTLMVFLTDVIWFVWETVFRLFDVIYFNSMPYYGLFLFSVPKQVVSIDDKAFVQSVVGHWQGPIQGDACDGTERSLCLRVWARRTGAFWKQNSLTGEQKLTLAHVIIHTHNISGACACALACNQACPIERPAYMPQLELLARECSV